MESWLELTCFHWVTVAALENGFGWDRRRDTTTWEAHVASERDEGPWRSGGGETKLDSGLF